MCKFLRACVHMCLCVRVCTGNRTWQQVLILFTYGGEYGFCNIGN
jgi:hypothetical protein